MNTILHIMLLVYVTPAGPATCYSEVRCPEGVQSCEATVLPGTCREGTPEHRTPLSLTSEPPTLDQCLYASVLIQGHGDVADVLGCSPDALRADIDRDTVIGGGQ